MININSKIYIAGHNGLVGSAILRKLKNKGYKNIIYRSKKQLNLKDQKKILNFLLKISVNKNNRFQCLKGFVSLDLINHNKI